MSLNKLYKNFFAKVSRRHSIICAKKLSAIILNIRLMNAHFFEKKLLRITFYILLQGGVVITPETVGTITPEHTGTITPLTPKNFVREKPL